MHIMDALGVLEYSDSEGFQNIIVNILDIILEDAPIILPDALPQLESNLILKVDAPIRVRVSIPICVNPIHFCPGPEFIYGHIFCLVERTLISSNNPCGFLSLLQDYLVFVKRLYHNEAPNVAHYFIKTHRGGYL